MKVLVTGGAGYIGSVVAARLLEAGNEVVVLDDLSTGHADAVPAGAGFVRGRVHDAAGLLGDALRSFDAAIHLAAKSLVAESIRHPELYEENNVVGSRLLFDALASAGVRIVVFSSTAAVYGEPDVVPIPESAPCRPLNPYGASKLAIDEMLAAAAPERGFAAVSLRYFNVAGAYGPYGERHEPETHLIPLALAAAGGQGELQLFGDDYDTDDGTCVRDYVHVVDIADAHLGALERAVAGRHDVFNLGNGSGYSVREVLLRVEAVTGTTLPVRVVPRRPGDPAVLVASAALAAERLSWVPRRPDLGVIVADAWAFARRRGVGAA